MIYKNDPFELIVCAECGYKLNRVHPLILPSYCLNCNKQGVDVKILTVIEVKK